MSKFRYTEGDLDVKDHPDWTYETITKDVIQRTSSGLSRMLVSLPKFKFMDKPLEED